MSISSQIDVIRKEFGSNVLVLGHHYQRQEVLDHADATGDSLELARRAADETKATRIVFCGVRFMAESADILTNGQQTIYMPEPEAGCPMADMADVAQVQGACDALESASGGDWLPVVYVNSSAAIKALCGAWGGSTCTSSNADKVFEWVLSQGKRVFFLPDEHLGVNTACKLGIPDRDVVVFDPALDGGGLTATQIKEAKVVVWKGYCHVHTNFTAANVQTVRQKWPEAKIIVHPETPREVTALTDAQGSTSQIITYVAAAPEGSVVVIGTETNLVDRLAREHAGRITVRSLAQSICPNMYMTTEESLLEILQTWDGANEVHVHEEIAQDARAALQRMLSL